MDTTVTPLRAGIYGRQSLGKVKSINEQLSECAHDVAEQGWQLVRRYDDSISASRFGRGKRAGYDRLHDDIAAGHLDVVVVWDPSRGDRTLTTWSAFLDLCRAHRVLIRVTDHDRTYDMAAAGDWKTLADEGVQSAVESERRSRATLRGVRGAAQQGRPAAGYPPFGFRRVYDPGTGELVGQEPDEHALTVVWIFESAAAGLSLGEIGRRLDARKVPPPRKPNDDRTDRLWQRNRIRDLLTNPAYAGLRVHQRQGRNASRTPQTFDGGWTPIVEADLFHSVQRLMADPDRVTTRPGQVHLLSHLGTCLNGHPLVVKRGIHYSCQAGCVQVSKTGLDELVEAVVVEALADPKVYKRLRQAGEVNDADVMAARNESATLKARLTELRRSAAAGVTSLASLAEIETDLTGQIEAAERRAKVAAIPPALRPFIEPSADVDQRWDAAGLTEKRIVIRALVEIVVQRVGRAGKNVPVADRVEITPRT